MKSALNEFFEVLATRMSKENDLSDMTYALCEADQGFRRFFIEYFFGSGCFDTTKVLIEREVSSDDSRPDFWITLPDRSIYLFNATGNNDYAFVGVDYKGETARFSVLFEDAKYWGERVCRLFDGRRGEDGIDVSEQGVRFTMMTTAASPTKDQIKRFLVTVGRRIGDVAAESIDEDVQLGGKGFLPSLNCYRAFRNLDLKILEAIVSCAHTNVGISYYNHPSSRDQLGRCGGHAPHVRGRPADC